MKTSPTVADRLKSAHQYLIPARLSTDLIRWLTRRRHPKWLVRLMIATFVRSFKVNMVEAVHGNVGDYPDFNTFFTRPLHPGVRCPPESPEARLRAEVLEEGADLVLGSPRPSAARLLAALATA